MNLVLTSKYVVQILDTYHRTSMAGLRRFLELKSPRKINCH